MCIPTLQTVLYLLFSSNAICRDMEQLLSEVAGLGFAGVQNFPTVGLIDGHFRENLESTGMSYEKEVEMIRIAKEQFGLLTTPYCFTAADASAMAKVHKNVKKQFGTYT